MDREGGKGGGVREGKTEAKRRGGGQMKRETDIYIHVYVGGEEIEML